MTAGAGAPPSLESRIKASARACGFDLARITAADELSRERDRYRAWVAEGRQGTMRWIDAERAEKSAAPASVLPGAQSVITVAISYWAGHRPPDRPNQGRIARYAWGRDYHLTMGERLERFVEAVRAECGGEHRWYVDTGPLMEKALAARAGLGWYGRNTNLLTERFGSLVLLGEVVTTLALRPDPPLLRDCGSCRLCVSACPTGALDGDYRIDARLCISYLTIEHRGWIPLDLREKMGNWVFGCDICQDVCPPTMLPHLETERDRKRWTQEARRWTGAQPDTFVRPAVADEQTDIPPDLRPSVDLLWLLRLTHDEYLEAFRGSSIRRAKAWMLRRNAAVALGNAGDGRAVLPLINAMRRDEEPLVRGHSAWALGRLAARLGHPEIVLALQSGLDSESDPDVRVEIVQALHCAAG